MARRGVWVMAVAMVGVGCRPTPEGNYVFDVAESKACVSEAVKQHPEEKRLERKALEAMDTIGGTMHIDRDGTFKMSNTGTADGKSVSDTVTGTWTRRYSRLTFSGEGKDDEMICDIDGKRLRCFKPMTFKVLEHYVMIKSD